jgi:uncharacterized RDD family membrane protein YckC
MSTTPPPPSPWRPPQPDEPEPGEQVAPPEPPPPPAYPPPPTDSGYRYPQPAVPVTAGMPAEWWRRVVAILLDGLILSVPYVLISNIFGINAAETDPVTGDPTLDFGTFGALSLLSLVVTLLYSGWLEGNERGQSVGKMALRIQVRDVDTGGPIGFGRAVLRRFVYTVLWYLFGVPGLVNALSPLWDARNQAWHDKAARTVVVRAE